MNPGEAGFCKTTRSTMKNCRRLLTATEYQRKTTEAEQCG